MSADGAMLARSDRRRQVHDANGEDRLLTMNRSDFRRFEPRIEIVEP
jgi:hypothetical protein